MDEPIPTTITQCRVQLTSGGAVLVRRVKRSTRDKLLAIANPRDGDAGSQAAFLQLLVRAAVVGAEGLTNADTGQAYTYRQSRHPQLGLIADEALYDALPSDEDAGAIAQAALPGGLSEAAAKN